MKDIISAYQKQNFLKNSSIIIFSLAIAFAIHTFAFDGHISRYIKASVLEIDQAGERSDLYLLESSGSVSLQNGKKMNGVSSLSFSLVYDASKVLSSDFLSKQKYSELVTLIDEPGLATFVINFSVPQDLTQGSEIFELKAKKIGEEVVHINLLNANFRDTQEEFFLSTSGTIF